MSAGEYKSVPWDITAAELTDRSGGWREWFEELIERYGLRPRPAEGYAGSAAFAVDDIAEVVEARVTPGGDCVIDFEEMVVRLADGRFALIVLGHHLWTEGETRVVVSAERLPLPPYFRPEGDPANRGDAR